MAALRRVLVIAASDSSGGAGLTRDVATISHFGVQTRCAVTAVTVQTDREVRAVHHIPPELVQAQIQAALAAGDIGAIKIGMLGRRTTVQAVIEALPPRTQLPIVLDPVLRSSSGGTLLDPEGQELLRAALMPRVSLLTPNIPEAAVLLGESCGADERALTDQARRLLRLGPQAVLLKGGHAGGERVSDILVASAGDAVQITGARVPVQGRGTGCSLASAIAVQLMRGQSLLAACTTAQRYVRATLEHADGYKDDDDVAL
jgi:hydroxymethylpyrimidine/phosphomethylpyrimidine kinase